MLHLKRQHRPYYYDIPAERKCSNNLFLTRNSATCRLVTINKRGFRETAVKRQSNVLGNEGGLVSSIRYTFHRKNSFSPIMPEITHRVKMQDYQPAYTSDGGAFDFPRKDCVDTHVVDKEVSIKKISTVKLKSIKTTFLF